MRVLSSLLVEKVANDVKTVTCRSCRNTGGEEFRLPDGTHRCPKCGSTDLDIHLTLSGQVSVHSKLGRKARRAGEKKPFLEAVSGDDLRKRDGRWMKKKRVIDREADTYDEIVIDPQAGETVHECHEPLSGHRGHGSAKTRGQNASEQEASDE
jgi:hypothetical protein